MFSSRKIFPKRVNPRSSLGALLRVLPANLDVTLKLNARVPMEVCKCAAADDLRPPRIKKRVPAIPKRRLGDLGTPRSSFSSALFDRRKIWSGRQRADPSRSDSFFVRKTSRGVRREGGAEHD